MLRKTWESQIFPVWLCWPQQHFICFPRCRSTPCSSSIFILFIGTSYPGEKIAVNEACLVVWCLTMTNQSSFSLVKDMEVRRLVNVNHVLLNPTDSIKYSRITFDQKLVWPRCISTWLNKFRLSTYIRQQYYQCFPASVFYPGLLKKTSGPFVGVSELSAVLF